MVEKLTKPTLLIQLLSWFIIFVCYRTTEAQEGIAEHKLIFLQLVSRHGERSPFAIYPTDPNPISVWPEGLRKVTQRGKKQQYEVGKILRSMYSDFITSNPNEVFVNCTGEDYSIRSAESLLASLYAPTPEWKFVDELDWQPIPIHYEPDEKKDGMLTQRPCKIADITFNKIRQSPEYKSELKKFMPMLRDVMLYSGIKDDYPGFLQLLIMYDNMQVAKSNGLIVPLWAQYNWSDIGDFFDFLFNSWVATDKTLRIYSRFLVQHLVENMEKKIAGAMPERKVHVYSAHDLTVALLLNALNVYNGMRPPIAATVTLELYETPSNQRSVRILYLNSTQPEDGFQELHVLTLNGCTEYCPYEYFLEVTKDLVTNDLDWDTMCQNVEKT